MDNHTTIGDSVWRRAVLSSGSLLIGTATGLDDGATNELRANGNPGTGLFEIDQATSLAEPFTVKGSFEQCITVPPNPRLAVRGFA